MGRHYQRNRKPTTHGGRYKSWLPYEDEILTRSFREGKTDAAIHLDLAAAGYQRTPHAISTRRCVLRLIKDSSQMEARARRDCPIAQDEAFCAAMQRAIDAGLENPPGSA